MMLNVIEYSQEEEEFIREVVKPTISWLWTKYFGISFVSLVIILIKDNEPRKVGREDSFFTIAKFLKQLLLHCY